MSSIEWDTTNFSSIGACSGIVDAFVDNNSNTQHLTKYFNAPTMTESLLMQLSGGSVIHGRLFKKTPSFNKRNEIWKEEYLILNGTKLWSFPINTARNTADSTNSGSIPVGNINVRDNLSGGLVVPSYLSLDGGNYRTADNKFGIALNRLDSTSFTLSEQRQQILDIIPLAVNKSGGHKRREDGWLLTFKARTSEDATRWIDALSTLLLQLMLFIVPSSPLQQSLTLQQHSQHGGREAFAQYHLSLNLGNSSIPMPTLLAKQFISNYFKGSTSVVDCVVASLQRCLEDELEEEEEKEEEGEEFDTDVRGGAISEQNSANNHMDGDVASSIQTATKTTRKNITSAEVAVDHTKQKRNNPFVTNTLVCFNNALNSKSLSKHMENSSCSGNDIFFHLDNHISSFESAKYDYQYETYHYHNDIASDEVKNSTIHEDCENTNTNKKNKNQTLVIAPPNPPPSPVTLNPTNREIHYHSNGKNISSLTGVLHNR